MLCDLIKKTKVSSLEDPLTRSPFCLPAIYSCLKEENNPLTIKERQHIIEKGMADINPMEYGRFKISGQKHAELSQWMAAYETIGRSEKVLMGKLA